MSGDLELTVRNQQATENVLGVFARYRSWRASRSLDRSPSADPFMCRP